MLSGFKQLHLALTSSTDFENKRSEGILVPDMKIDFLASLAENLMMRQILPMPLLSP